MHRPTRIALLAADYPLYEKYCPNFTGMQDGLKELGIEHQLFSCRPRLDVQAVIDYKPDFIVYGLLDMVKKHHWRKAIRESLPDAKIVMWYGDLRDDHTVQIDADMSEIDIMFVSNNAQNAYYEEKWKVPKCRFLPLGASIKKPVYNEKFDFDFVFIGARITGAGFLKRAMEIGKLQSEGGLKVIDGSAQREPELRARILKVMPDIYFSSKVCLDMSHFVHIDSYTSNRFWNITASGGFALTRRFPNCETFYPDGTRVYFDEIEEAIKLKDYYLEHPDEREKIRKAGYEHAKLHTYSHRFAQMFAMVYGT